MAGKPADRRLEVLCRNAEAWAPHYPWCSCRGQLAPASVWAGHGGSGAGEGRRHPGLPRSTPRTIHRPDTHMCNRANANDWGEGVLGSGCRWCVAVRLLVGDREVATDDVGGMSRHGVRAARYHDAKLRATCK